MTATSPETLATIYVEHQHQGVRSRLVGALVTSFAGGIGAVMRTTSSMVGGMMLIDNLVTSAHDRAQRRRAAGSNRDTGAE